MKTMVKTRHGKLLSGLSWEGLFDRRKVSNPPKPSWKKQSEIKIDDEGGTAKPKERTCEAHRSEVVNPTMMKR